MIWFACKQCGKRHKKPDEAAGSLVFCDCGQANRVPWESTAPAPEERPPDEGRPGRRRFAPPDEDDDEDEREPARGRRYRTRRRDPAHCLNHEDEASATICADCGEGFCPRCLVEFQGQRLCAACKNFRVRKLQRPRRVAGLTIAALVAGLVSAPLIFCITIVPASAGNPGAIVVSAVVGMLFGAAAVVLGLLGLREAEAKAANGGRGLALTGAALGTAGLLWSLSLVILMASRVVQE
jgi:hypothetical protein